MPDIFSAAYNNLVTDTPALFMQAGQVAGAASNNAMVGIINPAANNKLVLITRLDVISSGQVKLHSYAEANFPLSGGALGRACDVSRAAATASLRAGNAAGIGTPLNALGDQTFTLTATTIYNFISGDSPILVPPGYGFFATNMTQNSSQWARFTWIEK